MSTNIKIIHSKDLIRATADGKIDFEMSKKLLCEIVASSALLSDYEIILDTRNAQVTMSVIDLWYLAAELSKVRRSFPRRKTAVLCPREDFDSASFFALCAQNRGYLIQAFNSFEEAIDWLIENGT